MSYEQQVLKLIGEDYPHNWRLEEFALEMAGVLDRVVALRDRYPHLPFLGGGCTHCQLTALKGDKK